MTDISILIWLQKMLLIFCFGAKAISRNTRPK
jgi:hypothetical protein